MTEKFGMRAIKQWFLINSSDKVTLNQLAKVVFPFLAFHWIESTDGKKMFGIQKQLILNYEQTFPENSTFCQPP